VPKNEIKQIKEDATSLYNEEEYILTPCRFSVSGWKYVKKANERPYLNHPNKVNSIGYNRASIVGGISKYHESSLSQIEEESSNKQYLTPIKS